MLFIYLEHNEKLRVKETATLLFWTTPIYMYNYSI